MNGGKLIYLSLGSNLGDRAANLERAVAALPGIGVPVLRRSLLYETEPVDFLEQPWFLNCAVEAETDMPPVELLDALQGIERHMGSKKLIARGPRIIDLDVLLYGGEIVRTAQVEIPHPRMAARRFVLVPLAELSPALCHPILQVTIAQLLAGTRDKSTVRVWKPHPNEDSSTSN